MGIPGLFIGPLILGITYAAYKIYRKEKVKSKPVKSNNIKNTPEPNK